MSCIKPANGYILFILEIIKVLMAYLNELSAFKYFKYDTIINLSVYLTARGAV